MGIVEFFQSLFQTEIKQNHDGTYPLVKVDCVHDIKDLIEQFEHMPVQEHIDNSWIIENLKNLENNDHQEYYFVDLSKKITEGKDLNYAGNPDGLVKMLKFMYPNIKFSNLENCSPGLVARMVSNLEVYDQAKRMVQDLKVNATGENVAEYLRGHNED